MTLAEKAESLKRLEGQGYLKEGTYKKFGGGVTTPLSIVKIWADYKKRDGAVGGGIDGQLEYPAEGKFSA